MDWNTWKEVELREQWSKCLQSWPLATVAERRPGDPTVAAGKTAHVTPASWLQWPPLTTGNLAAVMVGPVTIVPSHSSGDYKPDNPRCGEGAWPCLLYPLPTPPSRQQCASGHPGTQAVAMIVQSGRGSGGWEVSVLKYSQRQLKYDETLVL